MQPYRGMNQTDLDAAYDNAEHVGQATRARYVEDWAKRSKPFRTQRGLIEDLRYGSGPRHRVDFFPCETRGAPLLVYIHGGYWQANDKELYSFVAEGPVGAGFNVVLLEYPLAPAVRMGDIVGDIRQGVSWVINHAAEFGYDGSKVFIAGHSAGGHLTAMALNDRRIAGALAVSGQANKLGT
jgi:arylformamidase